MIIDEVAGQGYLGENADKLKLVGDSMSSDQLGFIFPLGSDLIEPVNAALSELMANGFLQEVNAQYFGRTRHHLRRFGRVGQWTVNSGL
ncbi:MAG: transporter substrate-binding domain-containing protein [Chloroflexi bacterium]|nr:transporter substrate-binding domain-containing protein [Chloroflexota bacterium]